MSEVGILDKYIHTIHLYTLLACVLGLIVTLATGLYWFSLAIIIIFSVLLGLLKFNKYVQVKRKIIYKKKSKRKKQQLNFYTNLTGAAKIKDENKTLIPSPSPSGRREILEQAFRQTGRKALWRGWGEDIFALEGLQDAGFSKTIFI